MKQLIVLLNIILLNMTLANAQTYGLDYKYDWNQAQQNLRYQEQQEIQARNAYYQRQQAAMQEARQKAQICINQIKNTYMALTEYPTISDGWHNVYATDNDVMCDVRKVYVSNGRVTKYAGLDNVEAAVVMTGAVANAKAMISIRASDGNTYIRDLYFLE